MGSIEFLIPRREPLSLEAVDCAYMVGSDGIPWETQIVQREDRLVVSRETQESGRFVIPWSTQGGRCVALSTATLISSDVPYHLALELCRGTLNQLQQQIALWESRGWSVSDELRQQLTLSLRHFVQASLSHADAAAARHRGGRIAASCCKSTGSGESGSRRTFVPQIGPVRNQPGLWGVTLRGPSEIAPLDSVVGPPLNFCFLRTVWRDSEPNPAEWSWQSVEQMLQTGRRAATPAGVRSPVATKP